MNVHGIFLVVMKIVASAKVTTIKSNLEKGMIQITCLCCWIEGHMKKDIALYEWEKKTKEFKPNVFFSFLFPLKGFIPNPRNLHKLIFLCIIDGWVDGGGKFVFNLKNPFVGFASPYFGHHVTKIHHKKNLDSWMKLIYGHFFKIIVNEVYSSLSIFCSQYIYNPFNTK